MKYVMVLLLVLVILLTYVNVRKDKLLYEELRKRVKAQLDLASAAISQETTATGAPASENTPAAAN